MKIIILSHELNECELDSLFWLDEYGWCFDWYENEKEKEQDCTTYGLFPSEYVDDIHCEKQIMEFLKTKQNKFGKDIPIDEFFKWLEIKGKGKTL